MRGDVTRRAIDDAGEEAKVAGALDDTRDMATTFWMAGAACTNSDVIPSGLLGGPRWRGLDGIFWSGAPATVSTRSFLYLEPACAWSFDRNICADRHFQSVSFPIIHGLFCPPSYGSSRAAPQAMTVARLRRAKSCSRVANVTSHGQLKVLETCARTSRSRKSRPHPQYLLAKSAILPRNQSDSAL